MASLPTSIKYTIYDSFTSKRFRGNPAAVVLLSAPLEDTLYMEIAREFNLPMTAFVLPPDEPDAPHSDSISFRLRWITASMTEVIMCGHATLAAARYLFDQPELVSPNVNLINFATLSGNLTASRIEGDIELEFPSGELKEVDQELFGTAKTALSRAVKGVEVTYVGEGIGPSFAHMVVVVLKEDSALEGVEVDTAAFLELPHKGVIVTAKSALPDVHFISRAFLPRIGVDEDADPVTDSAHCLLAPYWIKQLGLEKGTVLSARQVSERGGEIDIVYDEDKKTCKLRGKAQTIAHGDMYLN